ncbi:hypothetical protein HGB07_07190 [Candidatus Roizmanbacteria bacterium]|nr:hypothetical protein [Candidatus Roizmanbacteria bacterium]
MIKKIINGLLIATLVLLGTLSSAVETKAATDAELSFDQATASVTVGQTVTLVAELDPGTNQVGAVELDVTFDPAVLELDSITRSAAFNTTLAGPTINNTAGVGSIDVGLLTNPPTYITTDSLDKTIATFVFTSLATANNSPVSFATTSNASAMGAYVVATRTNSQITVNSSGTDLEDPVVTGFSIPATSTSLTVPITTFTATDNVGVVGYRLTETNVAPLDTSAGWTATAPANYVFSSEGSKTLYAWAKDADGNVSTEVSDSVVITLPTYTVGGTLSGISGTVVLQNNAGDDLTLPDNGSFTFATALHTDDEYEVTVLTQPSGELCTVTNGSGTIASSNVTNVAVACVETVDPVVTAFVIPATADSLTVPIDTFTATDNVAVTGYMVTQSSSAPAAGASGWTGTAPTSFVFSSAGAKTLYAWAKDAAGNVSTSLNDSVTITLADTTAPTVTGFTIPETATSLTVAISSFTATDAIGVTGYMITESSSAPDAGASGWTGTAPTSFVFSSAGAKTLYAWAKDAAGNVSASLNDAVTITTAQDDPNAPILSNGVPTGKLSDSTKSVNLSVTTDRAATCKFSTEANVAYDSISNTFATTGETTHTSSVTGLSDDKSYRYYVRCQDGEGNKNIIDYVISFSVKEKKEEVELVKRKINNSQSTISRGQTLIQSGKRFSKNSEVLLYFTKANGSYYPPMKVKTSSTGKFSVSYRVNKPAGEYKWYALDTKTGRKSKVKDYVVK